MYNFGSVVALSWSINFWITLPAFNIKKRKFARLIFVDWQSSFLSLSLTVSFFSWLLLLLLPKRKFANAFHYSSFDWGLKDHKRKYFQSPGKKYLVYGGFIEGNIWCDPCDLLGSWFRASFWRHKQINLFTIQISIHNIIKKCPNSIPLWRLCCCLQLRNFMIQC